MVYNFGMALTFYLLINLVFNMYKRMSLDVSELTKEKTEIEEIKDDIKKIKLLFRVLVILFVISFIINFYVTETFINNTLEFFSINNTYKVSTIGNETFLLK